MIHVKVLRGRQVPPDLRHPQAQARQGEVHPVRERRRPLVPAQAVPGAVLHQVLRPELRAASQLEVTIIFAHVFVPMPQKKAPDAPVCPGQVSCRPGVQSRSVRLHHRHGREQRGARGRQCVS